MKNMIIDNDIPENKMLTVTQLMQAPFATGPIIVDFSQNKITFNGEDLILQPKVLELLIILCSANGKTLSKQELVELLWADTVVGPDSLANTMARLRKILNDNPKNPQFIKTVQRKGYLWLPSVMSIKVDDRKFGLKKLSLMGAALLIGALFYFFTRPEIAPKPTEFPFPDLSIQKLDGGGYEIQVGIEGKLTEEKKLAMLAELKRITGEEHSDMEFTVDDLEPSCVDESIADKPVIDNNKKYCLKKNKK